MLHINRQREIIKQQEELAMRRMLEAKTNSTKANPRSGGCACKNKKK